MIAGVAAFAIAYVGFAIDTTNWWLLAIGFVLAGIGIGCIETAEHSAVAPHVPEHICGSAFGLLAAVQSFGNLAASGIAGILWAAAGPTAAFAYIATWMIVALIALVLLGPLCQSAGVGCLERLTALGATSPTTQMAACPTSQPTRAFLTGWRSPNSDCFAYVSDISWTLCRGTSEIWVS